jgi:two-component system, OmpR family, sensor histidine kinase BaeS
MPERAGGAPAEVAAPPPSGRPRRPGRPRPLAWRLSAAFVAVTLAVVALFAVVLVLITRADLDALGRQQEQTATRSLRAAVESAYAEHDGWSDADLQPAFDLAAAAGARIEVLDGSGARVASTPGAGPLGEISTVAVVVHGATVGTLRLHFVASGLLPADRRLRSRLVAATGVVGGAAALLAVIVAVVVAGRISRPLRRFTRAVRAMEGGNRGVRIGAVSGAAELAALASGFDQMADTLDRQDRLRQALVADVAHELRTPIAVLQATCEAVIDGVREPSSEVVSSMHQEVLRLGKRVEDLGTLTSAETAGLHLTRAPVDLAEVATEAATALGQRFADAGVALRSDLEPTVVNGDAARLFQVVSNLLVNAAKFTPAGGSVRLAVGTEEDGSFVEVADDGVGIEPDEVAHVFERFWRGRSAAARDGSGIGLAIVAELVRAHGGTVEVHSAPGQGSTFRAHLPLIARPARRA